MRQDDALGLVFALDREPPFGFRMKELDQPDYGAIPETNQASPKS